MAPAAPPRDWAELPPGSLWRLPLPRPLSCQCPEPTQERPSRNGEVGRAATARGPPGLTATLVQECLAWEARQPLRGRNRADGHAGGQAGALPLTTTPLASPEPWGFSTALDRKPPSPG